VSDIKTGWPDAVVVVALCVTFLGWLWITSTQSACAWSRLGVDVIREAK
jgi:hypothetical protein